jgi:hypothetical protein
MHAESGQRTIIASLRTATPDRQIYAKPRSPKIIPPKSQVSQIHKEKHAINVTPTTSTGSYNKPQPSTFHPPAHGPIFSYNPPTIIKPRRASSLHWRLGARSACHRRRHSFDDRYSNEVTVATARRLLRRFARGACRGCRTRMDPYVWRADTDSV